MRIFLPDFLQTHTGQAREMHMHADSYRELIAACEARWPGFAALVEKKATVVINGDIVPEPLFETLPEGAEVCFLPKIAAG